MGNCRNCKNLWRTLVWRGKLHGPWLDFKNFANAVGPRPSKFHELKRIDKKLGYVPHNVQWVERKHITFEGRALPITEWAKILGVTYHALFMRLKTYKKPEHAFLRPWLHGPAKNSIWALRATGLADGVRFKKAISRYFPTLRAAVAARRALNDRSAEHGWRCEVEIIRRSPTETKWVKVI